MISEDFVQYEADLRSDTRISFEMFPPDANKIHIFRYGREDLEVIEICYRVRSE